MLPLLLACVLSQTELTPPPLPPAAPAVPIPSPPPLVPAPLVPATLEPAEVQRKTPSAALHFLPLSLFGLYLGVEYERGVSDTVSAFAAAGAGLLGQVGFDAGARVYLSGTVLNGAFVDGRTSAFILAEGPLVLLGPGGTLGYAWTLPNRAVVSLGLGATVWLSIVRPQKTGPAFFGARPQEATMMYLPGFEQPPAGQAAVQPTLRFTIGPAL